MNQRIVSYCSNLAKNHVIFCRMVSEMVFGEENKKACQATKDNPQGAASEHERDE